LRSMLPLIRTKPVIAVQAPGDSHISRTEKSPPLRPLWGRRGRERWGQTARNRQECAPDLATEGHNRAVPPPQLTSPPPGAERNVPRGTTNAKMRTCLGAKAAIQPTHVRPRINPVIPAKAGIQPYAWVPACAGMT